MCGIVSIFSYRLDRLPISPKEIRCIRDTMQMRGPDGKGLWIDQEAGIGLGHRRLSVIDLSESGTQPMETCNGAYRVVFNGEIYNHRELRHELEGKGYRFRSQSDTEVLLHLYADRGFEMVHSLRGMYAFALWDALKRGLFVVRDPFGIKPLYYADDGHVVRIASQVKSLLASGRVDTRPEPAGHVGFFLWGHIPEPYTLYKGIRALPAGSYIWVDENGVKGPACYFSVSRVLEKANNTRGELGCEDIREKLRTVLANTVERHLVSDVPVGIFLSSGLDSATITGLASKVIGGNLQSITMGFHEFEGTQNDETPIASRLAAYYGTNHRTCWFSKENFVLDQEKLLDAMDQPSIDGVNTYFISKAAAACGLKVVLSGVGGDEFFGGYSSFRNLPKMVKILSLMGWVPRAGKTFRLMASPFVKNRTSPKYAGLLEYGGTYGGAYLLRRSLYMPWELTGLGLLCEGLIIQGLADLRTVDTLEDQVKGISSDHLKVSALEISNYMRNQLLRDSDWAGMAHSIEIRVPFVDVELFQQLARFYSEKIHPDKKDMASTLDVPLPEEVLSRPKTGFNIPVDRWINRGNIAEKKERGLRSWAKYVYEHFN